MQPHHLTNFEIKNYYQNGSNFKSFHSKNNLPKTKEEASVITLDEYKSIGTV